jgi:hypothetical protein
MDRRERQGIPVPLALPQRLARTAKEIKAFNHRRHDDHDVLFWKERSSQVVFVVTVVVSKSGPCYRRAG